MAFSFETQSFIGAFLLVTLLSGALGHSYVTSPQTRSNQGQTTAGCRGPSCTGPCEIPLSARRTNAAVHIAQRGDSIIVNWPRNNHAGGFIRFAWAPTAQSDNHTYFDNHVQQINCHEVGGCHPDDPSNPNGGDSGPSDGSSRACSSTLKIPADLADGSWTLQWSWFGAAFSLGDYYSCIDYKIAGGAAGSSPVPVFVGGDYTYPNQNKCKFFNTDRLHVCVNEPCSNPIYPAAQERSGVPAYVQQNFNGAPAVTSTSTSASAGRSTTGSTAPQTTGAVKPSTTGSTKPSTTGAVKPSTTGAVKPSTTGSVKPSTTGSTPAPSPVTPPTSPVCMSGHMKCMSDNTFSMCNFGSWGPSQSCASGTQCSSTGDVIYCVSKSSPTPSTPTPSTPTPTPAPSDTCTPGYQKCVGTSGYSTCGNGLNGPTWSTVQSCQSGLACHPSSTANNIYCY